MFYAQVLLNEALNSNPFTLQTKCSEYYSKPFELSQSLLHNFTLFSLTSSIRCLPNNISSLIRNVGGKMPELIQYFRRSLKLFVVS